MLITNAFSLNMLGQFPATVLIAELTLGQAQIIARAPFESAVGHADTAAIFGNELCVPVQAERRTVSLKSGDSVLVGQYRGPRLPEGCSVLPDGSSIQWLLVTIR